MAHPVQVGMIRGIFASVRPVILAHSSCRRAKGSGHWSRAECSIGIRSRWSSRLFSPLLEELEVRDTPPPEINVEAFPDEAELGVLVPRKSAPEFFRVFAMSAKLTDFR